MAATIMGAKTRHVEPGITVVEISGRLNHGSTLEAIEKHVRSLIEGGAPTVFEVVHMSRIAQLDPDAESACRALGS